MNIFVLKSMQYLDNPELFTSVEMWENANNAWAVVDNDGDYDADCAASATTNAAYATADSYADAAHANYWLDKYFKETGEDKQTYINEVERLR